MELASVADALSALKNIPVQSGTSEFLSLVSQKVQDLYPQSSSTALANALQEAIPILNTSINMDVIQELKDSMVFLNSPEIAELQKQAKIANEELRIYRDAIKPYKTWLDMQKQMAPPPFDDSLIHEDKPEDTDQQGADFVETEDE